MRRKKDLNLPQRYGLDLIMPPKNNKDLSMNKYERQLLDLCIEAKHRVLNGGARGDFQGNLTYKGFHGCSTMDLVLKSEKAFAKEKIIQYLSAQDLSYLSDHKTVLLSLTVNEVTLRKIP